MVAGIDDYSAAIVLPRMVRAHKLRGGHPIRKGGRLVRYAGGFCIVFPYEVPGIRGRKYAVRLWHTEVESLRRRSETISKALKASELPYFVPFEFVPEALMTVKGVQPAAIMDWVDAAPLKKYIADNLSFPERLKALADAFRQMTVDLHRFQFSHGDLQHGNILVRPGGKLVLVDYDSMYVPGLEDLSDEIKGLGGYQHPSRWGVRNLSARRDYFSELIIYTSILALSRHPGLWYKYHLEDSETMLFTEADFASHGTSDVFRVLNADRELRKYASAILSALKRSDLYQLQPLEAIVDGHEEMVVQSLASHWRDNGFCPERFDSIIDLFQHAAEIAEKW